MATLPDFIAIARDIVQESCLRIPLTEPERISQCHCIFVSAGLVKEMCDDPDYEEDLQEDIAKLILYCALVVEHTADFLAKHDPNTRISVSRVQDKTEYINDILKSAMDKDELGFEDRKGELIDALAHDIGADNSLRQVTQYIEWSFERHSGGPQKAQEFIRRNHKDPTQVANLAQFLKDNPVSALALRGDDAVKFLDILEKAARSDSEATAGGRRDFQTYLRRLSYRSQQHPGVFNLCNVKEDFHEPKKCTHSRVSARDGGFGKVRFAKWTKPDRTPPVAVVAIKTAKRDVHDFDPGMFFHEAAFWYYLDPDHVVPFYGVAEVNDSPCLVSLWMDGARICCYVDGKEDSIRLDLLHQVAVGIKYLHDLNFVHCDIKPDNILVDPKEPPKALVTDFGCSNAARRTKVKFSQQSGYTPGYTRGDNITRWDPSNDVYAFGVTCCQVLLINKKASIDDVPGVIARYIPGLPSIPEDSEGMRSTIINDLRGRFFPFKARKPPSFFEKVFDLVVNTCGTPTCKIDKAIEILDSASNVARGGDSG